MISFKYYVEVVLDIQGKLSGQDRNLGTLNEASGPTSVESSESNLLFAPPGSTIVDTTPIRRDKAVVTCNFELIVGTRDSQRRKGKRRVEPEVDPSALPDPGMISTGVLDNTSWTHPLAYREHESYAEPPPFPLPPMPDESGMSEKERVRRQETRLLPSQPPGMTGDDILHEATAPYLPDEESLYMQAGPSSQAAAPSYSSATSAHMLYPHEEEYPTQDDKHELERLRLLAQASAPPGHDDVIAGPSSAATAPTFEEVVP